MFWLTVDESSDKLRSLKWVGFRPPKANYLVSMMVDDRSAMAKAVSLASDVFAISLLMVAPALIGHLIDQYLSLPHVLLISGFVVGMLGAVYQLIKLVNRDEQNAASNEDTKEP